MAGGEKLGENPDCERSLQVGLHKPPVVGSYVLCGPPGAIPAPQVRVGGCGAPFKGENAPFEVGRFARGSASSTAPGLAAGSCLFCFITQGGELYSDKPHLKQKRTLPLPPTSLSTMTMTTNLYVYMSPDILLHEVPS